MAQALQHDQAALIAELSTTGTADINHNNSSGSERGNAVVSIPLVQNIRQVNQVLFMLEPTGIARTLARKRVTVIDYPDGRLAIRHNGIDLPYRTFDKRPQVNQAAIVENKRLGPILAYIAEQQKELDMSRSAKAPRRRGQKNHMFKVG